MTIYYLSIARFDDKKANVIQQLKMCDALSSIGEKVCLIHPSYRLFANGFTWEEFSEYYGLRNRFDIRTVRTPPDRDSTIWTLIEGTLKAILLNLTIVLLFSKGRLSSEDTIYSRAFYPCILLLFWSRFVLRNNHPTIVQELHTPVKSKLNRFLYTNVDVLVCASDQVKQTAVDEFRVTESKCVVAPNGVDLTQYDSTQKEARATLGIPDDAEVVMYTGHLYKRKGAHVLVDAATDISGSVYIVGGYTEDVDRLRSRARDTNVHFTGFIHPAEVPTYQSAADVLVAPYTRDIRLGSPIKIFEYMASSSVIVASDLPMIKTYLEHEKTAFLAPPGDAEALASAVNRALRDDRRERIASRASEEVKKYSWEQRATNIIQFIKIPMRK